MKSLQRILILAGVLALSAGIGAAPVSASGAVRIRGVDEHAFPKVTLTVSIGSESVDPSKIQLSENGVSIRPDSVRPLAQSGERVDIVLVIDTSNSVAGSPLASAVAAARAFVTQLPPDFQVGLVTFAAAPHVAQSLTTEHASVLDALNSLSTTGGTALYDAVVTAAGMFPEDGQHNIVLLTDGADTAHTQTVESAVKAAGVAHASVFSVGLRSQALDEGVLQTLAGKTGGAYVQATEADLGAVYQRLAGELSHQYLVSYRSPGRAGSQVSISVSALDSTDTALALIPNIAVHPAPAAPAAAHQALLAGWWGVGLILGLSFTAALLLFLMLLGAHARIRRDRELAEKIVMDTGYGTAASTPDRTDAGVAGWIPNPVANAAEAVAQASGFAPALEAKLERAGWSLRAGEFTAGVAGAAVLGLIAGWLLLGNVVFGLLVAAVGAATPSLLLSRAAGRRKSRLQAQLADVVGILASSLRAGHSFFQALDMVSKEIGEPAGPEFQRVVAEIRLGRPVEEAMNAMAERVGSEDFKWAVLAVNIQREVGGNLAEILDTVADTVREREVLRRQVRVLSAEGRLSVKILTALPFLIGLYVAKVNPSYMKLLVTTRLGLVMLGTGAILIVLGAIWARKLVKVDV